MRNWNWKKWLKRIALTLLGLLLVTVVSIKIFHYSYNSAATEYWEQTCQRVERELELDLNNPPESAYHLLHEDIRAYIEDEDRVHVGFITSLELEETSKYGWHPFEMKGYQLTQLFNNGAFESESEAAEYLLSILVEQNKSIKVIEDAIDRKEVLYCDAFNPDKVHACFFQQSVCSYLCDRAVIQAISGGVTSAIRDLERAAYFLDENSQNHNLVGLLLYESCRFKLIKTVAELNYRRVMHPEELSAKILNSAPDAIRLDRVFAGEFMCGSQLLVAKDSSLRTILEASQSVLSSVQEALDWEVSVWDAFMNRLSYELVLVLTPSELLKAQLASIHNVYLDNRGSLSSSMLSMDLCHELSHYEVFKPKIVKWLDYIGGENVARNPMLAIYRSLMDNSAMECLTLKVFDLENYHKRHQHYPERLTGDVDIFGEDIEYKLSDDKQSYQLSTVLPSNRNDDSEFRDVLTIPIK